MHAPTNQLSLRCPNNSQGAPAELLISLALATTLIYIPLSMASLGRRLWMKYKFTDKRLIITNTSPLFARQVRANVCCTGAACAGMCKGLGALL